MMIGASNAAALARVLHGDSGVSGRARTQRVIMDAVEITEDIDRRRRRFLGTTAMTSACHPARHDRFGARTIPRCARTSQTLPALKPVTNRSFGPLKRIDARGLNIGYRRCQPPARRSYHNSFCTASPYNIYGLCRCFPLAGVGGQNKE